jgi:hypothetical protein
MKILAIAKVDPHTTLETIQPLLAAEVKQAWKLYAEGTLREMYTCQDRRLGVVFMLECSGVDAARKALADLPFVREKWIDFELISLGPFSHFAMMSGNDTPPRQG